MPEIGNKSHSGVPIFTDKRNFLSFKVNSANIFLMENFGEEILNQARAAYLRHGILTVTCLSDATAQTIKQKERALIDYIHKKLGGKVIKNLRFLA